MKWALLMLGILANAAASVLIKYASAPPRSGLDLKDPFAILTNFPLIIGLALYGIAFVIYALALSKLPLNVAHPILTSGAIVLVAISSALLFKETFYWTTMLGIAFVIAGVSLIAIRA